MTNMRTSGGIRLENGQNGHFDSSPPEGNSATGAGWARTNDDRF